jgi:LmbE family N-acetylglucosaminyl deacetylase
MTALPFDSYPLRPASYAATLGRTVIIIPHPDDEALGCGGLLALLRQANQAVAAVLVSDGTMSHPHSHDFSATARRELRYAELRHALAVLGVDESQVLYLGLPDSQVPSTGPAFEAAAEQLASFIAEQQSSTVLTPWRRDPHPDHRASSQLTAAALARLPQPPHRLEYVVWAWERAAPTSGWILGRYCLKSNAPLRLTARNLRLALLPTTPVAFCFRKLCWPILPSPQKSLSKLS